MSKLKGGQSPGQGKPPIVDADLRRLKEIRAALCNPMNDRIKARVAEQHLREAARLVECIARDTQQLKRLIATPIVDGVGPSRSARTMGRAVSAVRAKWSGDRLHATKSEEGYETRLWRLLGRQFLSLCEVDLVGLQWTIGAVAELGRVANSKAADSRRDDHGIREGKGQRDTSIESDAEAVAVAVILKAKGLKPNDGAFAALLSQRAGWSKVAVRDIDGMLDLGRKWVKRLKQVASPERIPIDSRDPIGASCGPATAKHNPRARELWARFSGY